MKKKIAKPIISPIYIKYSKSREMRFIGETPILPNTYVRHKNPIDKKRSINSYTAEGRTKIHKKLATVNVAILHYLMRNPVRDRSVKYNDNRLSLYCSQQGKCAVTGRILEIAKIHYKGETLTYGVEWGKILQLLQGITITIGSGNPFRVLVLVFALTCPLNIWSILVE